MREQVIANTDGAVSHHRNQSNNQRDMKGKVDDGGDCDDHHLSPRSASTKGVWSQ